MDWKSKPVLAAAITEKLELVQMLYKQGRPDEGMAEYAELRRLGHELRKYTDGNTRPGNKRADGDTPAE